MVLLIIPIFSFSNVFAQSEFDTVEMGLQMPTITMTPSSGPPGTEVEIKVTNMPPVPENIDPRIEFFVYLPFVSAIGSNVPHNCDGSNCFALYSFEEIGQDKLAPKTISFALFSTTNEKPELVAEYMETVCDLKINGQTIERYSETCDDIDQPVGDYEVKFGWGIQGPDLFDVREVLTFTVTEKEFVLQEREQDKDEIIIEQFLNGTISEKEFQEKLTELGYDDEDIRQITGQIGMLPHQEGPQTPPREPIQVDGTDLKIKYLMSEGKITQAYPDEDANSLMIHLDSITNGTLKINLPREVIDAKLGEEDDKFFVIVDGEEVDFEETKSGNDRILTINYPAGSEELEIIGTHVIPEFGTIIIAILVLSIVSVIVLSKSKFGMYIKA